MTVDTACSGSLVSVDLACRYLDSGDADGAIVAGCNLYMSPEQNMDQSAMIAAASPSGRCWTFDARADGYIKAEAINCLVLKRLDDALRDGDPIRAVIRGTSTNSDGWTPGIASPSPDAQARAIRRAYERAGIAPDRLGDTAYLECHGTGTLAGDPVECRAASSVFSASRAADGAHLRVGSVKSNIGHSEPAAGVSGMLKTVLAVERGIIPGNPTFEIPNPNIDFAAAKILPSRATTSWPEGMMRRASVNSFGYGGSNAHVIVEHPNVLFPEHEEVGVTSYAPPSDDFFFADDDDDDDDEDQDLARRLLVFSANDETSLKASVRELMRHLANPLVKVDPADLAYTLSQRRTRHFYRAYVVAQGSRFKESQVVYGKLHASPRVGLVFTGQGAQWPQMGRELLARFPVARATIEHLEETLQSMSEPPSWRLAEELVELRSSDHMRLPQFSQPLVTALQLALLAVLKDVGLEPAAVVGHSSGEIAAAVAAGCLSPEDGIKVAYLRGKAAEDLHAAKSCKLGMLAVGIGPEDTRQYLESYPSVKIACYNSPKSITLSGQAHDLERLQDAIKADGHFARVLMVDLAYHSSYMEEIAEHYRALLLRHCPTLGTHQKSADVQFFSTVDGGLREGDTGVDYWVANMVSPVLFDQGLSAMVQEGGAGQLIELGPSGALAGPIKQIKQAVGHGPASFVYTAALARGEDSTRPLFDVAGKLFFSGVDLNFAKVGSQVLESKPRVITDLPNYQWNHSVKYWHESLASKDWRYRPFPVHDLLGTKVLGTPWSSPTFRRTLRLNDVPWIRDHKLGVDIIFPASGYIAMAVEAVFQMGKASGQETLAGIESVEQASYRLRDVRLLRALVLEENADHHLFLSCYPEQGPAQTWRRFQISTLKDDVWTEHCAGFARISVPSTTTTTTSPSTLSIAAPVEPLQSPVPATRWYRPFRRVGFNFGPSFQNLTEIEAVAGQRTSRARINIPPPEVEYSRYAVHPYILDAFFQSAVPSLYQGHPTLVDKTLIPRLIDEIKIDPGRGASRNALATTSSHFVNGRRDKTQNYQVNATVCDETTGAVISEIRGLHFTELDVPETREARQNIMRLSWEADICRLQDDRHLEKLASSSPEASLVGSALRLPQTAGFLLLLLRHKLATPAVLDLDMLEHEPPTPEADGPVALGAHIQPLRRYSYVSKTAPRFADAQARLGGISSVDFHIHDATAAGTLPHDSGEDFDMVILRIMTTDNNDALESALAAAGNAVSRAGFLVLVQYRALLDDSESGSVASSSSEAAAEISWSSADKAAQLQSAGFDVRARHSVSDPVAPGLFATVYLCSPSLAQAAEANGLQFPVVDLSSGASEACSALVESLRSNGWAGEVTDLSRANTLPPESPILLLDSPEAPILAEITESSWNALRSLLRTGRRLLWLTSGSQLSVPSPSNALIHGFARSYRGEDPTLVLKILDLSSFYCSHAARSTIIAMKDLRPGTTLSEDVLAASENEYCERDGVIYISRVLLDEPVMEAAAVSTNGNELEDMWFRQNPKTVKLWCERVGAMGSLHFNELPSEPSCLSDGEVEVEVRAAGVNFKVSSINFAGCLRYRRNTDSLTMTDRISRHHWVLYPKTSTNSATNVPEPSDELGD